ncbi:MAG TPA: hypothetical protein VGL77_06445 [Armatimonadota bacterium]|jgi:hypothetical protein
MASTSSANNQETFDITRVFLVGTLLLAGILLAVPLHTIYVGGRSLAAALSGMVPAAGLPWVDGALWCGEFLLYLLVGWSFSKRKIRFACTGAVAGLLLRVLVSGLMACLLSARLGESVISLFLQMHGNIWVLHLLATCTVALIMVYPCRVLLLRGVDALHSRDKAKALDSTRRFSFNTAREMPTGKFVVRPAAAAAGDQLAPPPDFVPVVPKESVRGVVNIPAAVIAECIPEAVPFLAMDAPVRVRLAYIVPQLRRATVWLTWQQIFLTGQDDPNYLHGQDRPDAKFQGHWICIPSKYYVSQVPREHFEVPTVAMPTWMQRPAVPQEAPFATVEMT